MKGKTETMRLRIIKETERSEIVTFVRNGELAGLLVREMFLQEGDQVKGKSLGAPCSPFGPLLLQTLCSSPAHQADHRQGRNRASQEVKGPALGSSLAPSTVSGVSCALRFSFF